MGICVPRSLGPKEIDGLLMHKLVNRSDLSLPGKMVKDKLSIHIGIVVLLEYLYMKHCLDAMTS